MELLHFAFITVATVCLLPVGWTQIVTRAECSEETLTGYDTDSPYLLGGGGLSKSGCEQYCLFNAKCMGYAYNAASTVCHTSELKGVYAAIASASFDLYYLENCAEDDYLVNNEGCGYQLVPDTDLVQTSFYATQIVQVNGISRWQCADHCNDFYRCVGFTYEPTSQVCKLGTPTTVASTEASLGTEFYSLICDCVQLAPAGWHIWPNTRVNGARAQSPVPYTGGMLACAENCAAETYCKAIDYNFDQEQCFWHNKENKRTQCTKDPRGSADTFHARVATGDDCMAGEWFGVPYVETA